MILALFLVFFCYQNILAESNHSIDRNTRKKKGPYMTSRYTQRIAIAKQQNLIIYRAVLITVIGSMSSQPRTGTSQRQKKKRKYE